MPKKLVFIHGRAQQKKNSIALKQEWIDAWQKGLQKSGLTMPISASEIRFPYYGDTLDQLAQGATPEQAAQIVIRGPVKADEAERKFLKEVICDVQKKEGVTDDDVEAVLEEGENVVVDRGVLNWKWVLAALRVIDERLPGGSGASISLATHDVYQYLTNFTVRNSIDAGVLEAIHADEQTVVVSHSLGTVVAYSILKYQGEERRWQVPTFITVGCPLAVKRIRDAITPVAKPACVGSWANALDLHDVVALYPLQPPRFNISPATIHNKTDVANHTPNHHGISGYLDDAEVAKWIYDAVI